MCTAPPCARTREKLSNVEICLLRRARCNHLCHWGDLPTFLHLYCMIRNNEEPEVKSKNKHGTKISFALYYRQCFSEISVFRKSQFFELFELSCADFSDNKPGCFFLSEASFRRSPENSDRNAEVRGSRYYHLVEWPFREWFHLF